MDARGEKPVSVASAALLGAVALVLLAESVAGPLVPRTSNVRVSPAPAPDSLATTATTRDRTETAGSPVHPR